MSESRKPRVFRRAMLTAALATFGLMVTAPIAGADPCSVLDLGCTVEDTTTTVGGVVEDTTTTVGGVVEDTGTTVGGIVEGEGPIDAGPVVDGVVPGTQPGGAGDQPGSDEVPPGDGTPPGDGSSSDPGGAGSGSDPTLGVGSPTAPTLVGVGVLPGASGAVSAAVGHPFPDLIDAGSGSLSGARLARTLAFPLTLILLVVAFLFAQHRIDRKDPKLALAPVDTDHLTFS